MSDVIKQLAYACWRFDMWVAGHGSYRDIDEKVSRNELIPLVKPAEQEAALAKLRANRGRFRGLIGPLFRRRK